MGKLRVSRRLGRRNQSCRKTRDIVQLDESIWKRLSGEEKAEIERVCDEKLEWYYEKIERATGIAP